MLLSVIIFLNCFFVYLKILPIQIRYVIGDRQRRFKCGLKDESFDEYILAVPIGKIEILPFTIID